MKKLIIIGLLFTIILFSANAEGIYFDVGIGLGKPTTKLNGVDLFQDFQNAGIDMTQVGVDLGMKVGYGPTEMPLYLVGVMQLLTHRMSDSYGDYFTFRSGLIGPGLVYYPMPNVQVAGSFGYSFVSNDTSLAYNMYGSQKGTAWDASIAYCLSTGLMIGARYMSAKNTLEVTGAEQHSTLISVFIRYALVFDY